jgi:hypothetical protein
MATATIWSSSRPGTRLTRITSSPSLGEHCAGIIALDRREPPDDGEPGATAVSTSQRVEGFPDPAPLSQTPTQISSLRVCVG